MMLASRFGRRCLFEAVFVALGSAACNSTEPPFDNEYWDNYRDGIYVDAVNGEPLFSSKDKYDSGTGWPSFTQPIEPERVVTSSDWSFGVLRTEVRSSGADAHLGHVFDDGPPPTGLRYCINSETLRFIPAEDLETHGYREYRALFVPAVPVTVTERAVLAGPTVVTEPAALKQ